jgi:hypothetical protein
MSERHEDRGSSPGRRKRPRWMIFFTVAMLLLGGRMFLGGVNDLHGMVTGKAETLSLDGSLDAQQEALLRGQVVLANALARARPMALALHAAAGLGLGLLYLFAVAAVFSNDPRGRRVAVVAGWAGIAVSVGNALFLIRVVRRMLPGLLPTLVDAFAQDAARAGRAVPPGEAVAEQVSLFLCDVPLMVTGMGVVFSLLLIAYFAGQRVRLFYNQPRQVDHG